MADPVAPVAPAAAPANGAPPPEVKTEAAPDPKAELAAALKKVGGFKVKAGGKEHTIDSLEKMERFIQRGIPVEQQLEAVAKERSELTPLAAFRSKLQAAQESGDDGAVEAILSEMVDEKLLTKVAERRLRREYEKEKSMEGMSAREKQLAAELEQERSEKTRIAAEKKKRDEEAQTQVEQQQLQAVRQHIEGNVIGALKLLDLPEKLSPLVVDFMKPVIRASLNAGIGLDPQVLADKVRPVLDQLFEYQMKNLDGEKLLAKLGPVERNYRKALLAKMNGTQPAQTNTATQSGEKKESAPTVWDPRRPYR